MGTFQARTDELRAKVGTGDLRGRLVVDQPYAQDQHETLYYVHRGGGKARYLADPFFATAPKMMSRLARTVLTGRLSEAMVRNMEDLSGEVFVEAPFEFGDLKASGHPMVYSTGAIVYDRPPATRRLNKGELSAKDDIRLLGFGHNGWTNWHERGN